MNTFGTAAQPPQCRQLAPALKFTGVYVHLAMPVLRCAWWLYCQRRAFSLPPLLLPQAGH
jgi:hypothetical protein